MLKGDKKIIDGKEALLCPFTDIYLTEGPNDTYSHKGIIAYDIRGINSGVRYEYYAPVTVKCLKVYKDSGQVMWQSVNKVLFATGSINYITFMTAHDDNLNVFKGQIIKQGEMLGHMGMKGHATGIHTHIELSIGKDTSWKKNRYNNYMFKNEEYMDKLMFMDNTNIINMSGNFKYLKDYKPITKYVNLPENITSWRFYKLEVIPIKKNASGILKPRKFKGLSYKIEGYLDNDTTCIIKTRDYGTVKIYVANTVAKITTYPLY